jgi:hypothetical protein
VTSRASIGDRWVLGLLVAVLAIGCGERDQPSGRDPDRGRITVRAGDRERSVTVAAGNELMVDLSEAAGSWRLESYPSEALDLQASEQDRGRFLFVARASGRGEIAIRNSECPPPIPGGESGTSMPPECPIGGAGEDGTAEDGGGDFLPLFLLTVVVT